MSAFMVGADHIDALLAAGLADRRYGPLRWFWPEIGEDDEREAFQAGEPWGPRATELARERQRELTPETAGVVGAMLLAENRASVNHRYDEDEWEEPYVYTPRRNRPVLSPVAVLKALNCLEYQSCEHPGWKRSEAFQFCEALRSKMIGNLPGYDEAAWEVSAVSK